MREDKVFQFKSTVVDWQTWEGERSERRGLKRDHQVVLFLLQNLNILHTEKFKPAPLAAVQDLQSCSFLCDLHVIY